MSKALVPVIYRYYCDTRGCVVYSFCVTMPIHPMLCPFCGEAMPLETTIRAGVADTVKS